MGQEIERKFLIKELPENLNEYKCHAMVQGYLNTSPVVRVRKEDDTYYLTYKGGGLLSRTEYNLPLNEESFNHLQDIMIDYGELKTKVPYKNLIYNFK